MKKLLKFCAFSAVFLTTSYLPLTTHDLYAAAAGKVQLSVAAPDPVVAGEQLTFQVIMVNVGSDKWPAEQYYVETEVYDAQKNYVGRSSQMKGTVTVDPGMANLVYVPFIVPGNFVGTYFYRTFVVFQEQRVVESDYYTFNVIPLPVTPKKPSQFKLGGNAVLSYRQSSKYEGKDYTGNFNLNIVGQMMEHAMLFNMYTFHTPKSTSAAEGMNSEIYTILFNYYGDNWNIGLGDVLPAFTPLSLYGSGMRGGQFEGRMEALSPSFAFARTAKPIEGTVSTDGTYERWIMGGKVGVDILEPLTIGGTYVSSYDKQESLKIPGPSLTPASNNVAGGFINWNPSEVFGFEVEYQNSQYLSDLRVSTAVVNDYAYRVQLKVSPRNFNSRVSYQLTRPDFYAFGSPGATRDRQSIDFYAGYLMFNRLNINAGLNRFMDNLDKKADKVTTTQNIMSGGLSYASSNPWPSPSISYSMNEAIGDPITSQNNNTKTMAFGLTGKISIVNLSATLQQSDFTDLTKASDDLATNTLGLMANTSFGTSASINMGTTLTNTKNMVKQIINQTPAYSLSANLQLVPNKLSTQVWGTYVTRQNDAVNDNDKLNKQDISGNAELTWSVRQDLTWTLGGSYIQTRDEIAASNNLIEHGVNTRISYSF